MLNRNICEICKSKDINLIKKFNKKISGENLFGLELRKDYQRSLYRCSCGHFYNFHKFSKFLNKVYKKSYSNYSHNDIEKKFNKITSLKKKIIKSTKSKILKKNS